MCDCLAKYYTFDDDDSCSAAATAPSSTARRESVGQYQGPTFVGARLLVAASRFLFVSSNQPSSIPNDREHRVGAGAAPSHHADGLDSIRNLLDRVDVLGYGPTHPRVAVVIVGDDRSKILSSVESVFRYVQHGYAVQHAMTQ